MKSFAAFLIALLLSGCAHVQLLTKGNVLALCESEYEKVEEEIHGEPSRVVFVVEPGGKLLPKSEHLKNKAEREASLPKGLFETIMTAGNEFPDIGARAATLVWTDSEYIVFTTADEKYDIKATLLYTEGRVPFDLKRMARRISDRYDRGEKLQQSNSGDSEWPVDGDPFETPDS